MFIARIKYHASCLAGNDALARGFDETLEWRDRELKNLQKDIWYKFEHGEWGPFRYVYEFISGSITDTKSKRIWPIRSNGTKCGHSRRATFEELEWVPTDGLEEGW